MSDEQHVWLTVRQFAEYRGVSPNAVKGAINSGRIGTDYISHGFMRLRVPSGTRMVRVRTVRRDAPVKFFRNNGGRRAGLPDDPSARQLFEFCVSELGCGEVASACRVSKAVVVGWKGGEAIPASAKGHLEAMHERTLAFLKARSDLPVDADEGPQMFECEPLRAEQLAWDGWRRR